MSPTGLIIGIVVFVFVVSKLNEVVESMKRSISEASKNADGSIDLEELRRQLSEQAERREEKEAAPLPQRRPASPRVAVHTGPSKHRHVAPPKAAPAPPLGSTAPAPESVPVARAVQVAAVAAPQQSAPPKNFAASTRSEPPKKQAAPRESVAPELARPINIAPPLEVEKLKRSRGGVVASKESAASGPNAGRLKLRGLPELDIRAAIVVSEIIEPRWKHY